MHAQIEEGKRKYITYWGMTGNNVKPWPNDRNISTQHTATLLGATCCTSLVSLLRRARVATCWVLKIEQVRMPGQNIVAWPNDFNIHKCCLKNLSQKHPTCCNRMVSCAQHVPGQQCCDRLRWNVAKVCSGIKIFQKRRIPNIYRRLRAPSST